MGLELLFMLLPIAALSGWAIGRRGASGVEPQQRISQNYFRGLNYILEEQPDKAIDLFVQLTELDSDTVEVHFALGNLFRSRGEVERAIRIHQNLIARPTLTRSQRNQALLELGRDYMTAGLLDRAEGIFQQLLADSQHKQIALGQLVQIYQQEKEWERAINIARQLDENAPQPRATLLSHFHCELAEQAAHQGDVERALKLCRRALVEAKENVRANLLIAELYMERDDLGAALKALHQVEAQEPAHLLDALPLLVEVHARMGQEGELDSYLRQLLRRHPDTALSLALTRRLAHHTGMEAASGFLEGYLQEHPTLHGIACYLDLLSHAQPSDAPEQTRLQLLRELTARLVEATPKYSCRRCGFSGKSLHWQCPSCKGWDTIRPGIALDTPQH